MPVKTIMDYFLNSSDSSEKLISRKKPNGILIKDMDVVEKDNTTPFLQNFIMPKKKIVPQEMETKPKCVNNVTKLALSNQEVNLKKPEVKS